MATTRSKIWEQVSACLDWIESLEHPDGGICGAKDQPPYPEVTGYLIPTLMRWNRTALALRCAEWLTKIQNPDGSFFGWKSSVSRTFDTAQVAYGLSQASGYLPNSGIYNISAHKATKWVWENARNKKHGYLVTTPGTDMTHYYTILAGKCVGYRSKYWDVRLINGLDWLYEENRLHYLAYAIEGLQGWPHLKSNPPILQRFREIDKPFHYWYTKELKGFGAVEVLGNLQMSLLLEDQELFHIMAKTQKPDGSFPLVLKDGESYSWTARYFLEAAWQFYPPF